MKGNIKPGYDRLIENVIGLAETYIKLLQLELKTSVSDAIALILILISIIGIFSSGIFFLSIGLAFYLNEYFELSTHLGFLIVAFAYFISLPLVIRSRRFFRAVLFKIVSSFTKNN